MLQHHLKSNVDNFFAFVHATGDVEAQKAKVLNFLAGTDAGRCVIADQGQLLCYNRDSLVDAIAFEQRGDFDLVHRFDGANITVIDPALYFDDTYQMKGDGSGSRPRGGGRSGGTSSNNNNNNNNNNG